MKKKLTLVLCLALIAALSVSLIACSQSMFDGDFDKQATSEQARKAWDTASEAIYGGVSAAALAGDDAESPVNGWDGMSFAVSVDRFAGAGNEDTSHSAAVALSFNGSILFDMSGFAVNGSASGRVDEKDVNVKLGAYMQNNVYYADMSVLDSALQVKADASGSSIVSGVNSIFGDAITELSSALAGLGLDYTALILSAIPYDELNELGMKAYIDDSGDYNRVKFELPVEIMGSIHSEGESFIDALLDANVSLIIVTDKDANAFCGAKLDMNYQVDASADSVYAGSGASMSFSFNSASAVEGYPSDMDEFKSVTDYSIGDITEFFSSVWDNLNALME